jgi:hypothetical protein
VLTVEDEGVGGLPRRDEAGELADEFRGPGGDGVEVGLERGGQVGGLQRIVAGDAPGQPLRQPPVDRLRGGARRGQLDFLPILMPYFSITTLTKYPTTIMTTRPTKLAASTNEIQ